jgi:hypothetical protein
MRKIKDIVYTFTYFGISKARIMSTDNDGENEYYLLTDDNNSFLSMRKIDDPLIFDSYDEALKYLKINNN